MTVELILYPQAQKPFDSLSPYQLFQLRGQSDIWVKVSANYARIINTNLSKGKTFSPTVQVILLVPDSEEEEQ